MLKLLLPSEWAPLSTSRGDLSDDTGSDNLLPKELCASSFAQACAARKALQKARSTYIYPSTSQLSPSAPKREGFHKPDGAPARISGFPHGDSKPISVAANTHVSTATAAVTGSPDLSPQEPLEELALLLTNCRVLDVGMGVYLEGLHQILLQEGVIRHVRPMGQTEVTSTATSDGNKGLASSPLVGVEVDCGGAVLMPGMAVRFWMNLGYILAWGREDKADKEKGCKGGKHCQRNQGPSKNHPEQASSGAV